MTEATDAKIRPLPKRATAALEQVEAAESLSPATQAWLARPLREAETARTVDGAAEALVDAHDRALQCEAGADCAVTQRHLRELQQILVVPGVTA